jgi:hypothetical protein
VVATPVATPSGTAPATFSHEPLDLIPDPAVIGRHLDALQRIADENNGERAAGTPGYEASVAYVEEQLTALGYTVTRNPVDFIFWHETSPSTLVIGDQTWTAPEWLQANLYSGAGDVTAPAEGVGIGPNGEVSGSGGCSADDWTDFLAGHVAVVWGGGCRRRDVVDLAQASGAVALISMYPGWTANHVLQPTLVDPNGVSIPTIVVGQDPVDPLIEAARTGGQVRVNVPIETQPITVHNVIADLPAATDAVVMLGGHLDSVLGGAGLNDNGSGSSTVLAMAEKIVGGPQPQTDIRIGFWAAEEFGDIGSRQYVDSLSEPERVAIRAYLNLDMVASPNAGRYVYEDFNASERSRQLTRDLLDAFEAMGAPATVTDTGGASDHYAFEVAGIPVTGVFSGIAPLTPEEASLFGGEVGIPADACYHLSCDNRENIDLATAVTLASGIAMILEDLAY